VRERRRRGRRCMPVDATGETVTGGRGEGRGVSGGGCGTQGFGDGED
jgi:hypothetical protein